MTTDYRQQTTERAAREEAKLALIIPSLERGKDNSLTERAARGEAKLALIIPQFI